MDVAEYCREIETHLCRRNDGHLIRIVGPAFEQVCRWAEQGVPLKIAFRGIDQYCERYYAKGPRRRPVRIEFCEADILDLFDDWRRAVGIGGGDAAPAAEPQRSRRPSLAAHIDRALLRLTTVRATISQGARLGAQIDAAIDELDGLARRAGRARGDARAAIIESLAVLDGVLVSAALREVDPDASARLRQEAEAELAGFGARMAPEIRTRAVDAAFARLVRESLNLPVLTYE